MSNNFTWFQLSVVALFSLLMASNATSHDSVLANDEANFDAAAVAQNVNDVQQNPILNSNAIHDKVGEEPYLNSITNPNAITITNSIDNINVDNNEAPEKTSPTPKSNPKSKSKPLFLTFTEMAQIVSIVIMLIAIVCSGVCYINYGSISLKRLSYNYYANIDMSHEQSILHRRHGHGSKYSSALNTEIEDEYYADTSDTSYMNDDEFDIEMGYGSVAENEL